MKIHSVRAQWFHTAGRPDGQTDRHNEANSRFSQFCEGAYKLRIVSHLRLSQSSFATGKNCRFLRLDHNDV